MTDVQVTTNLTEVGISSIARDINEITPPIKTLWQALWAFIKGSNGSGDYYFVIAHEGFTINDLPTHHRVFQNLKLSHFILPSGKMKQQRIRSVVNSVQHATVQVSSVKGTDEDKEYIIYKYFRCN